MNDVNSEQPKPWDFYTSVNPSPSEAVSDREAPWRDLGTSVNAISFGFVATALLISLFLIMAIFEHLLKPRLSFSSTQDVDEGALESGNSRAQMHVFEKLGNQQPVAGSYSSDFSVLMPGQSYPTFLAQPAPLTCPREGVHWPSHDDSFNSSYHNHQ
ncbi:hypothetical protein H6P81_001467 [Aristolochia fimbriata]|uniref:Uncharacterized protein n=1 Tax=Aristolochia fimbriata TaxID=158543 RepID=A0AAV7F7N0_ARIFI|nr:hypothetical protein H6P81_001467 [Aristolochia fimbriata]